MEVPLKKLQMKISVGERGLGWRFTHSAEGWSGGLKMSLEKLQIFKLCW